MLAIKLIALAILLEAIADRALPHVEEVAGIFVFLVIVCVGMYWGAGPSLLATLVATPLLYYFIYPPFFAITLKNLMDMLQAGLVFFGGMLVSQAASYRESQRRFAEERAAYAEQARRQMEVFLGIASHELKTPLTSLLLGMESAQRHLARAISLQAGAVREGAKNPLTALQDDLVLVAQQARKLDRLVKELLDSSRIEAGHLELHLGQTDLVALVGEAIEEQRFLTPERILHLSVPAEPKVEVVADKERVKQVISNYLSNALKYSPEDRPVEVGIQTEEQQARVWVRDEGPGIPPALQAQVWERFYRVPGIEVVSGSGIGLGLGLYLSRILIERQGGQVGVESVPGQGACFWFTLPLGSVAGSPLQSACQSSC